MAIEEELGDAFGRRAGHQDVITELAERVGARGGALSQPAEPRVWHPVERPPHYLVPRATHVDSTRLQRMSQAPPVTYRLFPEAWYHTHHLPFWVLSNREDESRHCTNIDNIDVDQRKAE